MPQDPSMMGMGGDPSQMGMQDPSMMGMGGDPSQMGGDPNQQQQQGGGSPYDTNFDAGVEADEDEDPKKYIQQLTGKLSQELNKFNNENGQPDEELDKYVGKMITKAAAKYLDEKGRKDLIKAINTCDEPDDDMGDDGSQGSDGSEDGGMPQMDASDQQQGGDQQQMSMNEYWLSKRDLLESISEYEKDNSKQKVSRKKKGNRMRDKANSIFGNPFASPFK